VALSFLPLELSRWDTIGDARPELFVAPFFADERPLRGAAGLADWRLCGRLSRLILAGRVSGDAGETTLLPARKLPFPRLVLYGLGPSEGFDEERFREAVRDIRRTVAGLAVTRWALSLPGRATGRLVARRAVELWLEQGAPDEEVWLFEAQAGQKEMSDLLARLHR
jgi:hypothetical protein